MSLPARRGEAALVAALATLPLLPFLPRALSIDAPVFVAVAQQILVAPADPFGFDMVWDSSAHAAARFNRNPPLVSYWLALWMRLFGERDFVLHAAVLPFAPLAALAFLGVARRLAGQGLAPAALLVTTPAFLVLATSVLLDLPLLACLLGAVYALLRAAEGGGARFEWAAGALAAAAGLVKYVGFAAAPLLAAGALLLLPRPARALPRLLGPPLLAWGLWGAWTASRYGFVHFLGSTDVVTDKSFAPAEFWNQLASTLIWYGGALLFPLLLWFSTVARGRRGSEWALLGLLLGTACAWWVIPQGEPPRRHPLEVEEAVFAALSFAGAFLLGSAVLRPARWRGDRQELFLALWLGGCFFFSAFLNWHVNAADALLAAPPALCLLFRDPQRSPGPRFAAGCAALVLPLSLLLAAADAAQAGFYREAAARVAAEIGERPGARWSVGQWGFQHYLAQRGFVPVLPPTYGHSQLATGDWVATARNVSQIDVSADLGRYRLRREWSFEGRSRLPLRTTNPDAGSGFYSHHYGYVPFAWHRAPLDVLQLGRVVGPDAPPPWRPRRER
jgi:4-amino-4-deoxy-L-arabinose transferase-like glycosyltransferase